MDPQWPKTTWWVSPARWPRVRQTGLPPCPAIHGNLESIMNNHTFSLLDQPHRTTNLVRNRIKAHRKVRAGDLVPHEWNFRLHPEMQKVALAALYQEIGFAR